MPLPSAFGTLIFAGLLGPVTSIVAAWQVNPVSSSRDAAGQSGGVSISGQIGSISGDIVGGDKIVISAASDIKTRVGAAWRLMSRCRSPALAVNRHFLELRIQIGLATSGNRALRRRSDL